MSSILSKYRESALLKMKESLPEEPPVSDDVAAVRFQLPQGIKLARRFHKSHTVKVIITILHSFFFILISSFFINISSFFILCLGDIVDFYFYETDIYSVIDVT